MTRKSLLFRLGRRTPGGRIASVVLLVILVSGGGCALQEDIVEVRNAAPVTARPVTGADLVAVGVVTKDERTTPRDRVSAKKNGYGMEMAAIRSSNDVVAEVGLVVEKALQGLGVATSLDRDGKVEVSVHRIWNDFKAGFWSGNAVGDVAATITVRDAQGRIVFTRLYSAQGVEPGIQVASGENARLALVAALGDLQDRIVGDPQLAQALVALRAPSAGQPGAAVPPSTPAPAPVRIPRGGLPLG